MPRPGEEAEVAPWVCASSQKGLLFSRTFYNGGHVPYCPQVTVEQCS